MKDLVVVKSKTINNESVPVVFDTINPKTGEEEKRELSRPAIFQNFQVEVPLKWAKILIKMNPKEFSIIETKGKLDKKKQKEVKAIQEKSLGFKCSICGAEVKSKAGLSAHIRYNHPDKWVGKK